LSYTKLGGSTQNTVPCCQKYTPTDYFFGDFAHWVIVTVTRPIFSSVHEFSHLTVDPSGKNRQAVLKALKLARISTINMTSKHRYSAYFLFCTKVSSSESIVALSMAQERRG